MKKHLSKITMALAIAATTITAQTTADFQNLALSTGTYYNGSNGTPSVTSTNTFTSGNCIFNNKWNGSFGGYWQSGWAYSNMTNTTTAGSGNLYSAFAGSGYNSTNYAIGQDGSKLKFNATAQGKQIAGFYITNGTYAGISMRDGDQFAKKFGGASGNDPDWFKLKVQKYFNGVLGTDSVTFYLADFRFTNNTQDYILKTWQYVDVTSLGNADSLVFKLSSSDNSGGFMNTPGFFCIDNITTLNTVAEIKENNNTLSDVVIYPNPATNYFTINTKHQIESLKLFDVTGKCVHTTTSKTIFTEGLNKGIYFIEILSEEGLRATKKMVVK